MVDGPLFEDSQLGFAILGYPGRSTGHLRSQQIASLMIPAIPLASRGLNQNRVLILVVSERSDSLKGNPRGLCSFIVRGAAAGFFLPNPRRLCYKSSWLSPFLPFGNPSFPFTPHSFSYLSTLHPASHFDIRLHALASAALSFLYPGHVFPTVCRL